MKPTTILLALIALLSSCEKVINVDIDNAEKKYVIEGEVSNLSTQPIQVKLSRTKKFSDDNSFDGVSGAIIKIMVNNATTYTLTETTTKGVYRTSAFVGIPNNTYTLTVQVGSNTFTSSSIMPSIVKLDTLTVEDLSFAGSPLKTIYPNYLDPIGLGNSYRLIQYVNGILVKKNFCTKRCN